MKICGCMPLKYDKEKSQLQGAMDDMWRVCDEVIVLHEFGSIWSLRETSPAPVSEEIIVAHQDKPSWNDWVNRVTLLARAARLGCHCVMWLDDDERLGPTLDRSRVLDLCQKMLAGGCGQVVVRVRHLWNETHWRSDGRFDAGLKTFIQPNPFVLRHRNINFEWGPEHALHHFPNLNDPSYTVQDYIIHHGHKTRALREKSVRKYAVADPENKHSPLPYDWLLNETGIELKPISEP